MKNKIKKIKFIPSIYMDTNITIGDIRKTQIIEAALQKISQLGCYNITLEDIAEEAGLSKGGIAYYFSTKDALMEDTFREFFNRIFQRSRDTMNRFPEPLAKILSFDWLYDWDDAEVNTGYRLLFDFMSLAVRNESFRAIYHDWVNGWIELLQEAIEMGNRQGSFRVDDIDNTARTISSIYHGIAMRWYLDPESHSSEWAVRSFTESITRLLGV